MKVLFLFYFDRSTQQICLINYKEVHNEIVLFSHIANSSSDYSQGPPSASPDQPPLHAPDSSEACRPHRAAAFGHLLQDDLQL